MFSGQHNLVPASLLGEMERCGPAIPGGCGGKDSQIQDKYLPGEILSGNELTGPYFQRFLCQFLR